MVHQRGDGDPALSSAIEEFQKNFIGEARLVAWLVKHHLLLSLTAQKKDINDPNIVNEFARTASRLIEMQSHDYLAAARRDPQAAPRRGVLRADV